VGGSVLSRVFATILSRSEHCTAAFFAQGAKNYTDVKLDLLYKLILWTYIIFVRENNFLSPSVDCPDTSKRVPQIVTATETEWRNRFARDWIETKSAKNHDTLRDLKSMCERIRPGFRFWKFVPFFDYFLSHQKVSRLLVSVGRISFLQKVSKMPVDFAEFSLFRFAPDQKWQFCRFQNLPVSHL